MLDIKSIREKTGLSQPEFAKKFGLNLRVLRSYEQGTAKPTTAVKTLFSVIYLFPESVECAVRINKTHD